MVTATSGSGINLPAAKLHVQASNAQMLIGYSGNSQNFFDADNHYFRNSAFVNILQLGGDTILGTPNNNSTNMIKNNKNDQKGKFVQ